MTAPAKSIDYAEIAKRVNSRLAKTWPANLTSPAFTAGDISLVLSGLAITGVKPLICKIAAEVERERGGGK